MSHENNIVKKPWGHEYLVYENDLVALWFLHIQKEQSTSMHCHPNKTTGLMVISGNAKVSFLSNTIELGSHDKIMIRKSMFHSTKAISDNGALVFEIETPVDKHDLVRLDDKYGRAGKPYEGKTYESPKEDDCLWLEDPPEGSESVFDFMGSKIRLTSIKEIEELERIPDDINVMFLRGGITTDYDINVAGPGDIVQGGVLKKLSKVFRKMSNTTVILRIENGDC